jgi:G3E family GTPase
MVQGSEETAVDNWLELANGCLCCTMKSELVAGLEGMLAQRHRFDYILIETSGVVDPECHPAEPFVHQKCTIMH